MCAGAAFWTRIGRVVFGAYDEKRGYQRFQQKMPDEHVLHPRTTVKGGVLEEECAALLKSFFEQRRKERLN